MFARGVPSICYGLRGLVYFQIDLRGSKSDLHSGSFGGAVANPAFVLAQMLAQMKDRGGRIKIPGLLRRCAAADATRSGRSGSSCRSTRSGTGRSSARRSCSARAATRRSSAPGPGRPSRSTGCCPDSRAKGRRRCCRPSRWRRSACGSCPTRTRTRSRSCSRRTCGRSRRRRVELKVTRMHGGKPWMTEFDNPYVQAAGRAIEQGFGKEPVFTREGGSIPVVVDVPGGAGPAVRAVRRRPAGRERPRAEREARPRQLPQRRHRVGLSSTTRSRGSAGRSRDCGEARNRNGGRIAPPELRCTGSWRSPSFSSLRGSSGGQEPGRTTVCC